MVKPTTIRVIISLALIYKWDIQQIDTNNTFLNGTLQDEVHMVQPTCFTHYNKDIVCKLNKALYKPQEHGMKN